MKKKIAIWAGGSIENLGDRLIPHVTASELRRRLPEFLYDHFCPWSRGLEPSPLWIDSTGSWPGKGSYCAAVVAGGGVFAGPPFMHPLMQIFCFGKDPKVFDPEIVAAWNAVGIQENEFIDIGNSGSDVSKFDAYLDSLGKRLNYVTVRDERCAIRLSASRLVPPRVVPDPVFALNFRPRKKKGRYQGRPRIAVVAGTPYISERLISSLADPSLADRCPGGPPICIPRSEKLGNKSSPIQRIFQAVYCAELVSSLDLLSKSAEIEILSVKNIYADDAFASYLSSAIPKLSCRIVENPMGICGDGADFEAVLKQYDGVIASRFHTIILAMRNEIPFVAVDPFGRGDEKKSKLWDLLSRAGLLRCYWAPISYREVGCPSPANIADIMFDAISNAQFQERAYQRLHDVAQNNFDELANYLGTN